jgi:hypothetical protein
MRRTSLTHADHRRSLRFDPSSEFDAGAVVVDGEVLGVAALQVSSQVDQRVGAVRCPWSCSKAGDATA